MSTTKEIFYILLRLCIACYSLGFMFAIASAYTDIRNTPVKKTIIFFVVGLIMLVGVLFINMYH